MNVILGVTGCIGAYKAAIVLRLLQKNEIAVYPVMTHSATKFLGPLTLEKLSGNPVVSDLFGSESSEIQHIALARRSGLLLVAPATANILAKFASGIADDFLSTIYLSTTTPVMVAPAMNVEMWHHPATRENLEKLRRRGVFVVEPGVGYQACGEEGEGRLAEPDEIVRQVLRVLSRSGSLGGKRVLVTAGPTVEDIDPVRYVSNRSSGKMGYALAAEAVRRGANVCLISGPVRLAPPAGAELVLVRSAAEMARAVFERFGDTDIVVQAAAVADYRPVDRMEQKRKKSGERWSLELEATQDILKELGTRKSRQFLVGFAAESERLVENAREKLRDKSLDLIVANDISIPGSGIEADENQVTLIDRDGELVDVPRLPKIEVARKIWDNIEHHLFS
ncbi:MAG: bifunctional phosphopantothenoylcysteine decarboxylase/phosphopantothenate--cysteine ligase CoaBC [Acidobacteriota bacterium]